MQKQTLGKRIITFRTPLWLYLGWRWPGRKILSRRSFYVFPYQDHTRLLWGEAKWDLAALQIVYATSAELVGPSACCRIVWFNSYYSILFDLIYSVCLIKRLDHFLLRCVLKMVSYARELFVKIRQTGDGSDWIDQWERALSKLAQFKLRHWSAKLLADRGYMFN